MSTDTSAPPSPAAGQVAPPLSWRQTALHSTYEAELAAWLIGRFHTRQVLTHHLSGKDHTATSPPARLHTVRPHRTTPSDGENEGGRSDATARSRC
jgi:hypothetical protein